MVPGRSHGARKGYHGARKVYHGARKVYHGARKVYHGARKVCHGGSKVYHDARNRPQRVLGTRRDLAKKLCNICVKTAEPEFISSNTILAL